MSYLDMENLPEEEATMLDVPDITIEAEDEEAVEEEPHQSEEEVDEDARNPQDEGDDQYNNHEESTNKRIKTTNSSSNKKKPRQKTSKWIVYLSENRKKTMEANPELSFPQITKLIAEQYKSLSSEELERLEKTVSEINAFVVANTEEEVDSPDLPISPAHLTIPLARVKKCMKLDPDVKNVSRESIALMTKATELFIQKLTAKSQATGAMRGGKTIKLNDLINTIHYEPIFDFLAMDFPKSLLQTTNPSSSANASKSSRSRKDSQRQSDGTDNTEKEMKENAFDGNVPLDGEESKHKSSARRTSSKTSTAPPLNPPVVGKNSITNYFVGKKRSSRESEEIDEEVEDQGEGGGHDDDDHEKRMEDDVIEEREGVEDTRIEEEEREAAEIEEA